MPGKTVFIPWSNHEWNKRSLSKVAQGWLKTDKGLLRAYPVYQPNLPPPLPQNPPNPQRTQSPSDPHPNPPRPSPGPSPPQTLPYLGPVQSLKDKHLLSF